MNKIAKTKRKLVELKRCIREDFGTYQDDKLVPIDDKLCEFLHRKLRVISSRLRRVLAFRVLRSVLPLRWLIFFERGLGFCRERV
ncbi:unnamed protein product [Trifolium pratense]|uniref:Uncharacterized protein n=1 Tax=Trifolium pratense TaxID=57577 RepID=A0ACB0K009_TRIPR|nr:unnamed protein product [Trifolium pratense]